MNFVHKVYLARIKVVESSYLYYRGKNPTITLVLLDVPMTQAQTGSVKRIQTKDVVRMARIVPMGMDFWASFRSPDLFDPAMIPVDRRKIS